MWASAPTNIYNRTQILCTIGEYADGLPFPRQRVLPSSLRGNCSRWERCLHAGGAVVQLCRESIVCWLQCSSTGLFCGTAVQPDSYPAPLFAHFFWRNRKSGSAKQQLRSHRKSGTAGANRADGPTESSAPTSCRAESPAEQQLRFYRIQRRSGENGRAYSKSSQRKPPLAFSLRV